MNRKILVVIVMLLVLSFVPVLPASAAGMWIDPAVKKPVTDYAYSFVVVGDTQVLCYKDATEGTSYMSQIYDWIVANKEEKKIEYVFGLGDITDQDWLATGKEEWRIAKENIYKLNGVVPYSMVRGNHDSETFFIQAFSVPEYKSQFEQFYKLYPTNTYRTITICEDDYLMITLDHGPKDDELEWASKIIEQYPNHRVVITTHWYLGPDGQPGDVNDYGNAKPEIKNHGTEIWNKLIKKHSNVFMIMSGHYSSDNIVVKQRANPAGNKVTQVLIDPQGYDANTTPAGMIGIFYFSEDGKAIDVEYFSPIKNQFFREENQFRIAIPRGFQKSDETTVTEADVTTAAAASAQTVDEQKNDSCGAMITPNVAFVLPVCIGAAATLTKRKKER